MNIKFIGLEVKNSICLDGDTNAYRMTKSVSNRHFILTLDSFYQMSKSVLNEIENQPSLTAKFAEDPFVVRIFESQYQFLRSIEDCEAYRFTLVKIRHAVSKNLDLLQQIDEKLGLSLFTTRNFKTVYGTLDIGTCKQGELQISFERLVEVFGQPWYYTDEPGDKSDVEWPLLFDDGTVATIYNYKNGKNYAIYSDGDGEEIEDIFDWSIGGNCPEAATLVKTEIATFKFQN